MVKVLMAVSEPSLCDNLQEFLTKEGCRVINAQKEDAVQKITSEKPQIILLDIDLFGVKGLDTLEKISGINKEAMIIAVTSYEDRRTVQKIIKLGAFSCVTKPVESDAIKQNFKSLITMLQIERFGDVDILLLDYDEEKINSILDIFSKKGYKVKSIETKGSGTVRIDASCDLLIIRADALKEEAVSVLSKYREASAGLPAVFVVNPQTAADFLDKTKEYGRSQYLSGALSTYKLTMIIYKMIANYRERKMIKQEKRLSGYILVVDDEPGICEFAQTYLRREGYKVSAVSEPGYALEKVESLKPSIVLLDIVMPDISGLELLKKIKKISPRTQVIIMTGLKDESVCREAIESGACDYLVKPFSLEQLKAMIIVNSIKFRQTDVSKNADNH